MTQYNLALLSPGREGSVISGWWKGVINFYRLALPLLAALTDREKYRITAFDECVDRQILNDDFDLVAMSVMTPYAPRAYELAKKFQSRGSKVILGGNHPTLLPDEAEQYADAVAIGDAELTWPQIIQDFERKQLKRRYNADRLNIGLNERILPDRSVLRQKSLMVFSTAETSRGCPYTCDHCSVSAFYTGYRQHPLDTIIEDLAKVPGRYIFFVDDNFIGSSKLHRERIKEVLRAITPLRKRWFSQVTIQFADDPELLELAIRSGCAGVYIGFESVAIDSLREIHKGWSRPDSFSERIKRIRDRGIAIEAGLMFGFDNDTPDIFERAAEFVHQTGIESPNAHILTPYPGTPLYRRLETEGRIFSHDWSLYNTGHVVFRPAKMTTDELQAGYEWWYREVFSLPQMFRRIWRSNLRPYSLLTNTAKAIEIHRQFGSSLRS